MILKIDYEHIFFDRFENIDKMRETDYIITKALEEIGCTFKKDANCYNIEADFEQSVKIEKLKGILKKEFFILTDEKKLDEKAVKSDICCEIISYIRQNYQYDTLTVDEICENVNLSRYEAEKYVKRQYGITISEYIRNLRVEKAQEMLKENITTELCAQLCGFGSAKTMQRAFGAVCGITPAKWRSANLDSKEAK